MAEKRRSLLGMMVLVVVLGSACVASGNSIVMKVQKKFNGRRDLHLMRAHDARRHGRLLSAIDLDLGGNGSPSDTGLYFAKIGIGTPSKDYYVQVDTGSDILWVNCIDCDKCPRKSDLGVDLSFYDPKGSSTGDLVTCDQEFCISTYDLNSPLPGCKPNVLCEYSITYGDGSSTAGYFVKDYVQLDRVTGNLQSASTNASVIFGCAAKQSGGLGSSAEALDGIVGFGQANSSMLSQLASAGKVKKIFAHCLDSVNGGGIFAIGEVVQPKVNTTAIVPNQYLFGRGLYLSTGAIISAAHMGMQDRSHYNVVLKAVEVDGDVLELPTDTSATGGSRGTIIDSGTTLAYLSEDVYDTIMTKIMSQQPGLKLHTLEDQFTCFSYSGSVDDGFPVVKFHFQGSLSLTVYPHDYLFSVRVSGMEDAWCLGWQNSGAQSKDGKDLTLLGDLVLSNKLVLYDLEEQTIGWVEYNCSSHITVKDETTGATFFVGAHDLSSATSLVGRSVLTFLALLCAMLYPFVL